MTTLTNKKILDGLKDKETRELFAEEHVSQGVPFQIHALREKLGLTQAELARRAGMAQERISVLEDPNYEFVPKIPTLIKLANVFDVPLIVKFGSWSELFNWETNLSPELLAPKTFEEELDRLEESVSLTATYAAAPIRTHVVPGTLLRQLEETQVGVIGMGSSVWAVAPENLGFNNLAGYWRAYRTNIASTVEELAAAAAGVNWPYFSDVVTEASAVTEETDRPTSVADILKHVNSDTNVINYLEREAA